MFFKSQSNNNNASVSTRLVTFYSSENSVTLSAWNNNISVRISPCTGTDANGVRQYDTSKDKTVNTSITPDNAYTLLKGIEEKVFPAIANGVSKSVSIVIGNGTSARKVLTIGYNGKDSYMDLALNVEDNGVCKDENILHHTFSNRDYLEDYDHVSGGGIENVIHSDLIRFYEKLKTIEFSGAIVAHGIEYAKATRSVFNPNQVSENRYTHSESSSSPARQNNYSAPVQNFEGSDMSDLLPFD